jgi:hypothetical protein
VGFEHATPARALLAQGALAALGAGLAWAARRLPRRAAGAAVALGVALVVLAPARAEAQDDASSDQGTLGVEVRLGYLYPFISGNWRVAHDAYSPGTRLDFSRDLKLQAQYVLPTFEVHVGWKGIGRVWVDYFESRYQGTFGGANDEVFYRNVVIPQNEVGIANYEFRTIGLHGAISIPILDFITLELIGTTRYARFHSDVRAPRVAFTHDQSTLEFPFIPGLGPGFEFFILDKLYAYGDLAWIDFSVPKKHPLVHYREGHLGLRYELFDHLHIGGEVEWLDIELENSRFDYTQRIIGPRLWVAAAF